jgi:hypothetical protein
MKDTYVLNKKQNMQYNMMFGLNFREMIIAIFVSFLTMLSISILFRKITVPILMSDNLMIWSLI